MKVLVPLDGSRLADGILAHVRRVLLRGSAEIHLLRVLPTDADDEMAERHLQECKELLEGFGEKVVTHVERGNPAEVILDRAESGGFDLITMATHGRSGLDRFVRGSIAERVLRNAPVPVFLANPQGVLRSSDDVRFERILVPHDGSKRSAHVLSFVVPIAKDSKAEVILLHVDSPTSRGVHPVVEVAKKKAQQRAEGALERWIEKLTKANVNVKVVGRYGDPAEQIQDVIGESKIDLVAMASHGRTGLARWRFGSVAEKVLRDCRCPVLVETSPRRG